MVGRRTHGPRAHARTYLAAFYEIPCNATATVDLSFGGQAYAFDRADLVLGKAASDTTCVCASHPTGGVD